MNVVFVTYGPIRDVVDEKEVECELSGNATVEDLLEELVETYPELGDQLYHDGSLSSAVSVTVNGTSIDQEDGMGTVLSEGDEVRAAPPIHGG